jgi:hypothetical protein
VPVRSPVGSPVEVRRACHGANIQAAGPADYLPRVDREALTREVRRRQVLEALQFERSRADALRERLESLVAELDGPGLDERIFASMEPGEIEVVRPAVQAVDAELLEPAEDDGAEPGEVSAHQEWEIERLGGELDSSSCRQRAFERYLELLGA